MQRPKLALAGVIRKAFKINVTLLLSSLYKVNRCDKNRG
jgi:hypothetical protein